MDIPVKEAGLQKIAGKSLKFYHTVFATIIRLK